MARTTEDIKIASHVVPGKSPNYSSAPALYREAKLGQKQKFGYYSMMKWLEPPLQVAAPC